MKEQKPRIYLREVFGAMRALRIPMSLKITDETIKDASDLFRGIPYELKNTIMDLEFEGLRNLMDNSKTADDSIVLGGVVTGRIHSIPTVKELIDDIMQQAEDIIKSLPKLIK